MDIEITCEDCIKLFTYLANEKQLTNFKISSIDEINFLSFLQLFESIFDKKLNNYEQLTDEDRFKLLLDSISENLLTMDLKKIIKPYDLAAKTITSIYQLLKIFQVFVEPLSDDKISNDLESSSLSLTFSDLTSSTFSLSSLSSSLSSLSSSSLSSSSSSSSSSSLSLSLTLSSSPSYTPSLNLLSPSTELNNREASLGHTCKRCNNNVTNLVNTLPKTPFYAKASAKPNYLSGMSKSSLCNSSFRPTNKNDGNQSYIPSYTNTKFSRICPIFIKYLENQLKYNSMSSEEKKSLERFIEDICFKLSQALIFEEAANQIDKSLDKLFNNKKKMNKTSGKLSKPKTKLKNNCYNKSIKKPLFRRKAESKKILFPEFPEQNLKDKLENTQLSVMIKNLCEQLQKKEENLIYFRENELRKCRKQLQFVSRDVQSHEALEKVRQMRIEAIKTNALIRDKRLERVRIFNWVENYERNAISRYKRSRDRRDRLIRDEIKKQMDKWREDKIEWEKWRKDWEKNDFYKFIRLKC